MIGESTLKPNPLTQAIGQLIELICEAGGSGSDERISKRIQTLYIITTALKTVYDGRNR